MVLTAKEWGWSPTAVIRRAKNPHKPHPADYNFAQAVKTLLEEKCPQCGVPIWLAFNNHHSIAYKLKTITCHSCAHKDKAGPEAKDKKAGESHVVYAVPEYGYKELPSRASYFESEAIRHQAAHEKEAKLRAQFDSEE
jgi:hypothetical protein